MNLTEEVKRQIMEEFLKKIIRISDPKYQERVWIRGEGLECDDFDETVCQFFDIGDPVLDDYENFGITDSQYHLLMEFREDLRSFSKEEGEELLPKEFIGTPKWKKIMEMARKILDAFNYEEELDKL